MSEKQKILDLIPESLKEDLINEVRQIIAKEQEKEETLSPADIEKSIKAWADKQ